MRTALDTPTALVHRLNTEHANDRIHFEVGLGEFPQAVFRSPVGAEATLSLYGGHLLRWSDPEAGELLYLSQNAVYQTGKAIRGGVPIIFPWFGSQEGKPHAHGVARNQMWRFVSAKVDQESTKVTVGFDHTDAATGEDWNFALTYTLSDGSVRTDVTIENRSKNDQEFQLALHTYFRIRNIGDVAIEGLQGVTYVDTTKSERPEGMQSERVVTFPGRVDSIYKGAASPTIIRTGFNYDIELTSDLPDRVTWNPGEALALTMSDIGVGDFNRFVCVEPGAIENRALCRAGGTFTSWQALRVLRGGA